MSYAFVYMCCLLYFELDLGHQDKKFTYMKKIWLFFNSFLFRINYYYATGFRWLQLKLYENVGREINSMKWNNKKMIIWHAINLVKMCNLLLDASCHLRLLAFLIYFHCHFLPAVLHSSFFIISNCNIGSTRCEMFFFII